MNKLAVASDEIIAFLKKNIHLKEIYQGGLQQKVIDLAARERGIIVTPEEIQAECDRLRHEKRLEKASDTLAWLADEMITADELEAGICDRLLAQKLSEHLFSQEVEKFFNQNRLDFEQVSLYQIIIPSERVVQELLYQIEEKEISFYEAAHLYDLDERRRNQCGYEGKLYRWSLKPDIAAVIFSAKPFEIVPPIQSEQGYHLFWVEAFIPGELTPERHQEILDRMFKEWLANELNYMLHNQTNCADSR